MAVPSSLGRSGMAMGSSATDANDPVLSHLMHKPNLSSADSFQASQFFNHNPASSSHEQHQFGPTRHRQQKESYHDPYPADQLVSGNSAIPADRFLPNKQLLSDEAMHFANAGRIESQWANARRLFLVTLLSYTCTLIADIFLFPTLPSLFVFLPKLVRALNAILTVATALQFGIAYWESNVRPSAFHKMSNAISKLTYEQRKLFNVDPDIARLVDVTQPSAPSHDSSTAMFSKPEQPGIPTLPVRNMTRINLRSTSVAPKNTSYIPNTSDMRYSHANSIFIGDKISEPTRISTNSNTPGPSLDIPLKPVFQTYQRSAAPTAEEQKVAGGSQLSIVSPDDTLRYFGTNSNQLSFWVENVREWLATKIFIPLVVDLTRVEQFLETKGWLHLSLYNTVQAVDLIPVSANAGQTLGGSTAPNMRGYSSSAFAFGQPGGIGFGPSSLLSAPSGPPLSLNGLAQQAASEPLARLRVQLERYLYMKRYPATARGYIIRRIVELSTGRSLAKYSWNSGGNLDNGKPWTPLVLPTDAELVMHVFSTWIDSQMPGSANAVTYAPFSTKYIRWTIDEMKEDLLTHWTIVMSDKMPHFNLGFSKTLYDIYPKRNNVFAAIALFTFKIQSECSGYIDMLDIGGKVIGLVDVLASS